jgi:hypothetical protein
MMFALLALLCFVLDLFKVDVDFSLVSLGLAFVAVHLLVGLWPLDGARLRRP